MEELLKLTTGRECFSFSGRVTAFIGNGADHLLKPTTKKTNEKLKKAKFSINVITGFKVVKNLLVPMYLPTFEYALFENVFYYNQ